MIDKANKRLKGTNRRLTHRRLVFEKLRRFWGEKTGTWLAIDFEAWEMEHNLITEFGWSLVTWENGEEIRDRAHLIVKERRQYYNHKYVRGNRDVSLSSAHLSSHYDADVVGKYSITILVKARMLIKRHSNNEFRISSPSTLPKVLYFLCSITRAKMSCKSFHTNGLYLQYY